MHKKRPKSCTCYRVSEAKAGPGSDDRPDHPPVQTNSSISWLRLLVGEKLKEKNLNGLGLSNMGLALHNSTLQLETKYVITMKNVKAWVSNLKI